MTDSANDEGLAAARRHEAHPDGSVLLATCVEIRELAHVMDLKRLAHRILGLLLLGLPPSR